MIDDKQNMSQSGFLIFHKFKNLELSHVMRLHQVESPDFHTVKFSILLDKHFPPILRIRP